MNSQAQTYKYKLKEDNKFKSLLCWVRNTMET